jgi:hypothetical protein
VVRFEGQIGRKVKDMNKRQMKVLWVVIVVMCLMALFPVKEAANGMRGRGFVYTEKISVPSGSEGSFTFAAGVDLKTLIVQMIPVIAIGAGLMVSFRDKKDEETN